MTEKQEKILTTALQLFADKGYDATSTSKVAKAAGVSEGLIFRHFGNKEGLLNAIKQYGMEKAALVIGPILEENDPKKIIKAALEMPFCIPTDQDPFWKLLYALKWQEDIYDNSMSDPLRHKLEAAFTELKYENPAAEAEMVLILIDGVATSILLRKSENQEQVLQAVLTKYKL